MPTVSGVESADRVANLPAPTLNRLLAHLSPDDLARLEPRLERVTVKTREILTRMGEPFSYVYFPTTGVFSVTTSLPEGISVEAATVGNEGLIGLEAFLGANPVAAGDAMLQVPDGNAVRLDVPTFRNELVHNGAMGRVVGRYIQAVLMQMVQGSACNARHPVQERCAKWLLLTHDRMATDTLRISHEVLSMMLATTRPTVTVVARTLQQAGLISYRYGRVTIQDREGLEEAACSCYAHIREQFDAIT